MISYTWSKEKWSWRIKLVVKINSLVLKEKKHDLGKKITAFPILYFYVSFWRILSGSLGLHWKMSSLECWLSFQQVLMVYEHHSWPLCLQTSDGLVCFLKWESSQCNRSHSFTEDTFVSLLYYRKCYICQGFCNQQDRLKHFCFLKFAFQ